VLAEPFRCGLLQPESPGVCRPNPPDGTPWSRNSAVEQPDMKHEGYELVLIGAAVVAILFIGLLYYQSFKRARKWNRRLRRGKKRPAEREKEVK